VHVIGFFSQEALQRYVNDLAGSTGDSAPRGRMKSLFRILEKQAFDPNRAAGQKPSPVLDAARCMMIYNSMTSLAAGVQRIGQDHSNGSVIVLRVKERFTACTAGGWSDLLTNVQLPGTHGGASLSVCEIQLIHLKMLILRHEVGGHESYTKCRIADEVVHLHDSREPGNLTVKADGSDNEVAMTVVLKPANFTAGLHSS